jgi:putative endopeptidase
MRSVPASSGITDSFDENYSMRVDPYAYVNNIWKQNNPLPSTESTFDNFDVLEKVRDKQLKELIVSLGQDHKALTPEEQRIKDLYDSFMNEDLINHKKFSPIEKDLDRISQIENTSDVAKVMGEFSRWNINLPVKWNYQTHQEDPTKHMLNFRQGGIELPNRSYYIHQGTKEDKREYEQAREAYGRYLTELFKMKGYSDPEVRAQRVMMLEQRIARIHWDLKDRRDPQKTFNHKTLQELKKDMPDFDWDNFFTAAGFPKDKTFNIDEYSYVKDLAEMVQDIPVDTWKDYLTIRLMTEFAPYLHQEVVDAHFNFDKVLTGQEEMLPRWERGIDAAGNSMMEEAMSKAYLNKYSEAHSKEQVTEMARQISQEYRKRIESHPWMSKATKQGALNKLDHLQVHIHHPDAGNWRYDYNEIHTDPSDLVGNLKRIEEWDHRYSMNILDRPVNRQQWSMMPHDVNACYSPTKNKITFPAAILQPPFYNPSADDAANYGSIGAIYAHELLHAFDDEGSQYDSTGALNTWMTLKDQERYNEETQKLVTQYSQYKALPDELSSDGKTVSYYVDGERTLGENIADNAGLQIAYAAYRASLGGKEAPIIDGLTGDQRFFLSWAQTWRGHRTREYEVDLLSRDYHSPLDARVLLPLMNCDAFHKAFKTQPGDPMYLAPEKRFRSPF